MIVALAEAQDPALFGGKAASLGRALRATLPVPPGIAIAWPAVDRIANGDAAALEQLASCEDLPVEPLAVRSSAVGEDSSAASFAGQHATHLNVRRPGLSDAVRSVWESARSEAALAYRARKGLAREPAIAVVVQQLVQPAVAGVLFTRNPVTGSRERLIEASWGLGEIVVSGRVVPDSFRLDVEGRVLERTLGYKDVMIVEASSGGTDEIAVPAERQGTFCLADRHLQRLNDLAERCCATWGSDLDVEWAFAAGGELYLLQARPITTVARPVQ